MNSFKILSKKNIDWLVLIIIIVITAIIRIRLLDVPLERDEGGYAYTAQLMLQGIPPYLKAYSMRLPGLHIAYALIISLFGQTSHAIHTGLLIINSINILFIYLLSRFFLSKTGSLVSTATFALLSITYTLQGIHANSEHFLILFVTVGLFLLLYGLKNNSDKYLFYSGLSLGTALLMKQNGIFFTIPATVYLVYYSIRIDNTDWIFLLKRLSYFLFGLVLLVCLVLSFIFYIGIFKNFWFWTYIYAREYVSNFAINQALNSFLSSFEYVTGPARLLWIFIGLGLMFLFIKIRSIKFSFFLMLLCFFSMLSICPGFYFRAHYFILLIPCAAILAGLTVDILPNLPIFRLKHKLCSLAIMIIFIICILQTIYLQSSYLFFMTPFQTNRLNYGSNPFNESKAIAEYINKNTTEDDTIAVFGSEPQIFFYSKRKSSSGFIHMYPLMEKHKFALSMQKSFINDINKLKPKYIIYVNVYTSWLQRSFSHKLIFNYLNDLISNHKYTIIGLVNINKSKSYYYWKPDNIKSLSKSENWIGIYERSK